MLRVMKESFIQFISLEILNFITQPKNNKLQVFTAYQFVPYCLLLV